MRLGDLVEFRKDLLYSGAVQLGWLESNAALATEAATHYAFHGPRHHLADIQRATAGQRPIDTASFTLRLIERLEGLATGPHAQEPFELAIAGYGMGKSHLGVTIATLLADPTGQTARIIRDNIKRAEVKVGERIDQILSQDGRPFIVVALNGMNPFNLTYEIIRQVMRVLRAAECDTTPLEDLRPRFKMAAAFVERQFAVGSAGRLRRRFGDDVEEAAIVDRLNSHDEDAFRLVAETYRDVTGTILHAAGQESLDDFLRLVRDHYTGPGKRFVGVLLLFDELGHYLQFAVRSPHIAGSGSLQQLFEAVQANSDRVFMLGFIQSDLQAYLTRIPPELQNELQRYVTRFDGAPKTQLSSNIETLIGNMLEKHEPLRLDSLLAIDTAGSVVLPDLHRWFPESRLRSLWANSSEFEPGIRRGCWPLHPLATWALYRLSALGRSLQQRSALSLLMETMDATRNRPVAGDFNLVPADLCGDSLVDEFIASEQLGQQGNAAQAYKTVVEKYDKRLSDSELRVLRSVLLLEKARAILESREDCLRAISRFAGLDIEATGSAVRLLEHERNVLGWNAEFVRFSIFSDAAPRSEFLTFLRERIGGKSPLERASIFGEHFQSWFPQYGTYRTEFGAKSLILTREWVYKAHFTDVVHLPFVVEEACREWREARGVSDPRGQLIYCYVGPESDLGRVREQVRTRLSSALDPAGAPVAVSLLHDLDGAVGHSLATALFLKVEIQNSEEARKFASFIPEQRDQALESIEAGFGRLTAKSHLVVADSIDLPLGRLDDLLEELFGLVYPKAVPFPFDGFASLRGNGPVPCRDFTRELFRGALDKEWIAAQPQQVRSRALAVLDSSWKTFDPAGRVLLLPANPKLRDALAPLAESLERPAGSTTGTPDGDGLNLGKALRMLCAPPFGLNLASAGLALSVLFAGRRRQLSLLKGGSAISVENWLSEALPNNYLSLPVLDNTVAVAGKPDEWEGLLAKWESEIVYERIVKFSESARHLRDRMPLPEAYLHRYQASEQRAKDARRTLFDAAVVVEQATRKIEAGERQSDVGALASGGSALVELLEQMDDERGKWSQGAITDVKKRRAASCNAIGKAFAQWLIRQKPGGILGLRGFQEQMKQVAEDLETLGFEAERDGLRAHAKQVEEHILLLDQANRLNSDIVSLVSSTIINEATPMATLCGCLERLASFKQRIADVRAHRVAVALAELDKASGKIAAVEMDCGERSQKLLRRFESLTTRRFVSGSELGQADDEARSLIRLFDGYADQVVALESIQRQLKQAIPLLRELEVSNLTFREFRERSEGVKRRIVSAFAPKAPPLDVDALCDGPIQAIRTQQRRDATKWLHQRLAELGSIDTLNVRDVIKLRDSLQLAPCATVPEQRVQIEEAIKRCQSRLDDLGVESLVAQYERLPELSRCEFLARIGLRARD